MGLAYDWLWLLIVLMANKNRPLRTLTFYVSVFDISVYYNLSFKLVILFQLKNNVYLPRFVVYSVIIVSFVFYVFNVLCR